MTPAQVPADLPLDRAPRGPRRTPEQLARAVEQGRGIAEALRYIHISGAEPEARVVADALARFLVARCEAQHAGWRMVRQVIVEAGEDVPWEKCARRAIGPVADDLVALSETAGRTPLARAQHLAARRRVEQIAPHVDAATLLRDLKLDVAPATGERWRDALLEAVTARSREQVARKLTSALGGD